MTLAEYIRAHNKFANIFPSVKVFDENNLTTADKELLLEQIDMELSDGSFIKVESILLSVQREIERMC